MTDETSLRELRQRYHFLVVNRRRSQYVVIMDRQDMVLTLKKRWEMHVRRDGELSPRYFDGQRYHYLRRMIAEKAFGPPPTPKHVVEHLDGNTLDLRRANLKWSPRTHTQYQIEKRRRAVMGRQHKRQETARERALDDI